MKCQRIRRCTQIYSIMEFWKHFYHSVAEGRKTWVVVQLLEGLHKKSEVKCAIVHCLALKPRRDKVHARSAI